MELTVAIPIYNRADMLSQALESLRHQTFKDFVVVVCDDASTENLKEVADRFADLNIEYHRFEENAGQFDNAMRGLALCATPFLKYLHSDDILFPMALERQVNAMRKTPSAAMCLGGCVGFRESRDRGIQLLGYEQPWRPVPWKGRQWAALENYRGFAPSLCMFRTGLLREVGGLNTLLVMIGDWEVCVAISARYPIVATDEPICAYRFHDKMLSARCTFDTEEAYKTKDMLWLTSDENPMKERLGLPPAQLTYLRHSIAWDGLLQSMHSRRKKHYLIKWLEMMRSNQLVLSFIISFPLFVVRKLSRKPEGVTKTLENLNAEEYKEIINRILFPAG